MEANEKQATIMARVIVFSLYFILTLIDFVHKFGIKFRFRLNKCIVRANFRIIPWFRQLIYAWCGSNDWALLKEMKQYLSRQRSWLYRDKGRKAQYIVVQGFYDRYWDGVAEQSWIKTDIQSRECLVVVAGLPVYQEVPAIIDISDCSPYKEQWKSVINSPGNAKLTTASLPDVLVVDNLK